MSPDVTDDSLWRPLHQLLGRIDAEIARVYRERPHAEAVRTNWVMELLRLDRDGAMTIKELADSIGLTHSAMSQKVAAMGRAGLVRTKPGVDARTKRVELTPKAARLTGLMRAEWVATEQVLGELEAETAYPISKVVQDLERALARKGFYERLSERLRDQDAAS